MEQMTAPLRRINRAKEHLDVLNSEIAAFLASKTYRCAIDKDPQDGCNIFYPYLREAYPPTWGLLIGEVVHGLRSALDNLAWSLAIIRDDRTAFPIYLKESSDFTSRLNRLREDIRAEVKALQPYNAPNGDRRRHPLWVLHRIDIIDKHRLILPSVTKLYIATGLISPKYFWIDGFIRLNKGSVQFKLTTPTNLQEDFKPDMTGKIFFDISSLIPTEADDLPRLSHIDLFEIHNFVRNDVYPRFAKFLDPIDGIK